MTYNIGRNSTITGISPNIDGTSIHKVLGYYPWGEADKNNNLIIGKFCSIADQVLFMVGGYHPTTCLSTYPFYQHSEYNGDGICNNELKGDIVIGNDVYIGRNSTIMGGVHIGDGAVVATGSVVVKDVEPYTIVGGNPAKVIRKRFDDETINLLEEIKWWDQPDEVIKQISHLLTDKENPKEALNKIKDIIKKINNFS